MLALPLLAFVTAVNGANKALLLDASREDRAGWVRVHLKGSPGQIGYQHGYLLAPEINDCLKVLRARIEKAKPKQSTAYKTTCAEMHRLFWPKIPSDLRLEMAGIASGMKARGYNYSPDDILYLNALPEWGYRGSSKPENHCSAFIATGTATNDGKIVMAHSYWSEFVMGERWNVILDITPRKGFRFVMDAMPGLVDSGSDFAINAAGLVLCETTIAGFHGFSDHGIPEFVRMRMAIQYAKDLDGIVRALRVGNNGGYANTWLIGDTKSNEIGKLELGLKNVIFHRSSDGYYFGANYSEDEKLTSEECEEDLKQGANPCADRRKRWIALLAANRGKIDARLGMKFIADHHDEVRNMDHPSIGTICGHGDAEERAAYTEGLVHPPTGAVQAKVTTAALASRLAFWARMGRPCGESFSAHAFLEANPSYAGIEAGLRDMPTQPWTLFR